jgi:hypothetical protein
MPEPTKGCGCPHGIDVDLLLLPAEETMADGDSLETASPPNTFTINRNDHSMNNTVEK